MEVISRFVVMEHNADKAGLHWDLRFKQPDGTMWESFATKKGIPLERGRKVSLFKTSLHTQKDALFTGEIKSGYGKGTLKVWDKGKCIILKYSEKHIAIEFKGSKLKGVYHFLQFSPKDKDQYLFFKGAERMSEKVTLSENAQKVVESRYFMDDETWENFPDRVSEAISKGEDKKDYYKKKFKEMIYKMEFLPAGRIMRNSGRAKGTLLNCYHLPCGDSIEEIGNFIKESLILWSDGGGVGCNFSKLRPKEIRLRVRVENHQDLFLLLKLLIMYPIQLKVVGQDALRR